MRRRCGPGYEHECGGVWLEERRNPLRRVGVYIPGGRFPYPSTVLMTVIPARLAGVEEIVVATPPKAFATSLPLRFTLARLDVREIWGMGGAQAIAALAYGTETIRRVDKIVGPGNAWVTAAKQIVAGDVGIDGLPGPTEIVVFADATADPALVAADLLAQAEHDVLAAAILVTADRKLAKSVADEVDRQLRIARDRVRSPASRSVATGRRWWSRTSSRDSTWWRRSRPSTCSSWATGPRRWRIG